MLFFAQLVNNLFLVYTLMLLVRVLASWVPEWQNSSFIRFIAWYTEPYLSLFRRLIPPIGMLDISPIIAFLVLGFLRTITVAFVLSLA